MQDFAALEGRRLTRAHAIWGIGVLAYLAAVAARSAFGVASVEASLRFGVGGTVLSLFGVVQLGTYAAAQIPAGLLLDRWGPRRMMVLGALLMAIGQVVMALADGVPVALLARLLTGAGDAATLVSVLRLTAVWLPARQVPLFTQLATMIGQSGQAVAAIPFLGIVITAGWSPAFLALAALLLVTGVIALVVVRDEPQEPRPAEGGPGPDEVAADPAQPADATADALRASHDGEVVPVPASSRSTAPSHSTAPSPVPARAILREVLSSRGAWSGLLLHAVCLATVNSFLFLWGVPFLQNGHGIDHGAVSVLLTVNVLVMVVAGPCIGFLTGRFPDRRPMFGLLAGAVVTGAWIYGLALPEGAGTAALVPVMVGFALGSATCSVGFDLARTGVSRAAIGTASGFVNIGGFGGALLCVFIVGIVLDLRTGGMGMPVLEDYRVALAAQGVVMLGAASALAVVSRRGLRGR